MNPLKLYKKKNAGVNTVSLCALIPVGGTPYSLRYLAIGTLRLDSQFMIFYWSLTIQPIIFAPFRPIWTVQCLLMKEFCCLLCLYALLSMMHWMHFVFLHCPLFINYRDVYFSHQYLDYILASALWNFLRHFAIHPSCDCVSFTFFCKVKAVDHI